MTAIQPKKHSVGPSRGISIPVTKNSTPPTLYPRQFSLVSFSGYLTFFKVVYNVICYISFSLGLISVIYILCQLNFFFPLLYQFHPLTIFQDYALAPPYSLHSLYHCFTSDPLQDWVKYQAQYIHDNDHQPSDMFRLTSDAKQIQAECTIQPQHFYKFHGQTSYTQIILSYNFTVSALNQVF